MSTRFALVVSALILAVTAPAGAAGAAAQPERGNGAPGGFSSWAALAGYQSRMNAIAERVDALAQPGLGGLIADPTARELRVHWKGEVPGALREIVRAAPSDIPVRVVPAEFTERELLDAAKRIATVDGVSATGPSPDGSAVLVSLRGTGASAVRANVAELGVPVRVTEGVAATALSRQDDSSPYWGGSRFRIRSQSCSTGFGVIHEGAPRILTAGHCGENLDTAYDGGGTSERNRMGVVTGDVNARDTMLIRASAGGSVYRGPWNSVTSTGVAGAARSFAGNLVCTSGASSGEHCSVKVSAVKQTFRGTGYPVFPTVAAYQTSGSCAAASGDSGGPVFSVRADGLVDARGTVVGGAIDGTACPGVVPTGASRVWYVDVTDSLSHYDATILRG